LTQGTESGRKRWNSDIIVNTGRKLFYKKGFDLTMRDLANELGTRPSSLYRHVENKRELWFAIINQDFELFNDKISKIAQSHTGTSQDLLRKIGHFFFEFARQDFNRFRLMFLFEPPQSEKSSGPFEEACNLQSLKQMKFLVEQIIKEANLSVGNSDYLAYALISIVLGAVTINSPINSYLLVDQKMMGTQFDKFVIQLVDSLILGLKQDDNEKQ